MVHALSYTQQKEKCVYYGAFVAIYTTKIGVCVLWCMCCHIHNKNSVCLLWCMCCHIHKKEVYVYSGACVVIYATKREVSCNMVFVLSHKQ